MTDVPQPEAKEREVRIPLGELCREAMATEPDAPLEVLARLFEQRYGDDGPGFYELCVVQHDLAGDLTAWHRVVAGRVTAVVHIVDDVLPETSTGETFVVEDDDLSALPTEIQSLAEKERHRHNTGDLPKLHATGDLPPAPPIPLWEADRRQALTTGVVVIVLLAAAGIWLLGGYLGYWSLSFRRG